MARASVQPKQPWAGRDDQAVARETAETVSQEGKGAPGDGDGRGALEVDLTFGSHQGTELAREGQGRGNVALWQNEIPSYQGERCPGGRKLWLDAKLQAVPADSCTCS